MNDAAHQAGDQKEAIAFLSAPATYGLKTGEKVERIETHGALVFLAGDRVYKLKRAVRYSYMDFSTVEKREAVCRRELEVNRRTAPGIYLEVRAIIRDGGGLRFAKADEVRGAVDWVVVMKRFDQDVVLEKMRQRNALTPELMRELAEVIAEFHRTAAPDEKCGGANGIAEIMKGNFKVLTSLDDVFGAAAVERLARPAWEVHEGVAALLDRRRAEGRVRHGHGDLHLNNICLFEGKPTLFDALEFDEKLACIDVFYDLGFLLMDLDRHDARGLANIVLNRYVEQGRDYGGLATLPLFLSCRAAIRAHVTATQARLGDKSEKKLDEARALLDRAIAYLSPKPPRVIAIGGLSGTGKTTVSRALAPSIGAAPGAVVIRSDIVRKQIMGVPETARLSPEGYRPEVTEKVFATLASLAGETLAAGHAVILDAVYGDAAQRTAIEAVAQRARIGFTGIWLEAPEKILAQRIERRKGDASDATVQVMRDQAGRMTRPDSWFILDAEQPAEKTADEIRRRLKP